MPVVYAPTGRGSLVAPACPSLPYSSTFGFVSLIRMQFWWGMRNIRMHLFRIYPLKCNKEHRVMDRWFDEFSISVKPAALSVSKMHGSCTQWFKRRGLPQPSVAAFREFAKAKGFTEYEDAGCVFLARPHGGYCVGDAGVNAWFATSVGDAPPFITATRKAVSGSYLAWCSASGKRPVARWALYDFVAEAKGKPHTSMNGVRGFRGCFVL